MIADSRRGVTERVIAINDGASFAQVRHHRALEQIATIEQDHRIAPPQVVKIAAEQGQSAALYDLFDAGLIFDRLTARLDIAVQITGADERDHLLSGRRGRSTVAVHLTLRSSAARQDRQGQSFCPLSPARVRLGPRLSRWILPACGNGWGSG